MRIIIAEDILYLKYHYKLIIFKYETSDVNICAVMFVYDQI